MDLKEFTRLKSKVDELQCRKDRATGALEQLRKQLKDEFDCESVEEAQKLLAKMEKEESKLEKDFDISLKEFNEKYGEMMEG